MRKMKEVMSLDSIERFLFGLRRVGRTMLSGLEQVVRLYWLSLVLAAPLLITQHWWTRLHFLDSTEFTWNIAQQAASHATVLSILAAVTTLFISFTVGRYVQLYDEQKKQQKAVRFHFNASMAGSMLIFSLSCFGIAAFICAVLSGHPATSRNSIAAYAILVNVYVLYAFGFILTLLGGLYAARVFGLGMGDTRKYRWVMAVIAALALSVVHQHITLQVSVSGAHRRDWLWSLSIGILLLHEPITDLLKPRKWLVDDSDARVLAWMAAALTSLIPLSVVVLAALYLNIRSFNSQLALPDLLKGWYVVFYPAASLYLALLIGLFSEAASRITDVEVL